MTHPRRRVASRLVRLGMTAAVLVLLVLFAWTVDWGRTWQVVRGSAPGFLLLALAANLSSLVFRGVRWWLFLRAAGAPSPWLAMRATVAGAGLNNVLVANGGEAARVVFVARATRVPSSHVLATVALDRLFDPIGFLLLLAIGAAAFELPPELDRARVPALASLAVVAVLLVWLGFSPRAVVPEHIPERRQIPRGWRGRLGAWTAEFVGSMRMLATGPRMATVLILTVAAWLGQLATFALTARAARMQLPLAGSLAALLAVNVALLIRATPGNVGFFQVAYALAAAPFGVPRARAIATSLLIQALQIIPVTAIGVLLAPEFILRRGRAGPARAGPARAGAVTRGEAGLDVAAGAATLPPPPGPDSDDYRSSR